MDKAVQELLDKAPSAVIVIGIIVLIIYIIREYRKIREETEQSVKDIVNSQLGSIMASIQNDVAKLDLISKEQASKINEINTMFAQFTQEIVQKSEEINEIYEEAKTKLTNMKEAIPNVEEYSARDILGVAQATKSVQSKAEFCTRILRHQDATAKELELAGDMMREVNRYTLAMQLYEKAHQRDPERISPYIELLCLTAELDHEKREESIEKAKQLVLSKPTRNGFARVANALIDLDRYQELSAFSDEFIKKLEGKNPKLRALALRNKAVALKQYGDIPGAMEAFQEAFQISPEDENIIKPYLGLLEEQGKDEERMSFIKKLIEIDPADISYYRFHIDALLKKKQYAEAMEWIGKAEQLVLTEMDRAALGMYKQKAEAANNALQRTR